MSPARIAAVLAEGYGPASALLLATQRREAWAAVLERVTEPQRLERAAARVTLWRTIATRLQSHHHAGAIQ